MLCLHILPLSSPGLKQESGPMSGRHSLIDFFVSSRTRTQESGNWDICGSLHCWAVTWCHVWDWYYMSLQQQATTSRCKQHELFL